MFEEEREIAVEATASEEVVQEAPQHDRSSQHIYNMRKKLEAEADARRSLERRNEDLERALREKQAVQQPEEDDLAVDNEEYVQAKHVKTSNNKLRQKLSEQEKKIEDMRKQMAYLEARTETAGLKDFEQVVSQENMEILAAEYPDDYQCIMSNSNLRARSKTAYNMIKRYNIYDEKQSQAPLRKPYDSRLDDRIAANRSRPQAASIAAPKTPPTPLAEFGEERRILSESDYERIRADLHMKKVKYGLESPG